MKIVNRQKGYGLVNLRNLLDNNFVFLCKSKYQLEISFNTGFSPDNQQVL